MFVIAGFQLRLIGAAGLMVGASAENLPGRPRSAAAIIMLGCAAIGMILVAIAHFSSVRQD